jgi:hypothetical protein
MSKKTLSSADIWSKTSQTFQIKTGDNEVYEISRADFRQQLLSLKEFANHNHWELPREQSIFLRHILEILFAFKDYPEIYAPLVRDVDRVFGKFESMPKDSVAAYFISCVLKEPKILNTQDDCNISSSIAIYSNDSLLFNKINHKHIYIHVDSAFEFFDLETLNTLDKNDIKEVTIIVDNSSILHRNIPLDKLNTKVIDLSSSSNESSSSPTINNNYLWIILIVLILVILLVIIYRNRQSIRLRQL